MLGHLSFGVSDLDRAAAFYDRILAPLDLSVSGQIQGVSALARQAAATSWLCSPGLSKRSFRGPAFIWPSTHQAARRWMAFTPRRSRPAAPIAGHPD